MLSAKQRNYLVRLWYDAVVDWGFNAGPPALEASTIPLGYRGVVGDWGLNLGPPALDPSTIPLGYRGVGDW